MPIFKRTFAQDLDLLEQHLTKEIISQTDCKTILTKLRTMFENAFNSEFKERMQKYTRFDAQSFKDAMICNMDSIGKYMLEIILHQQRTPHLLKQKKLMQTQEDHSNPIQALNINSLKESNLDSVTKDVHAIKYKMSKAKERCMVYFRSLHSHLQVLSKEDLKGTRIKHGFKRAFMSLFDQDVDTFTSTMLLNVDQLQKQLDKDEFQEDGSMVAFWVVNNQFQKFIDSQFTLDYDSQMTDKYFVEYTGIECSGIESKVQDDNSKSGNDTDADDADIRPIYDEEPLAEVQLTAEWQHGHILNETSNKAMIKKEIDAYETINIELEHSVAKLLIENEHLNKENETVKKHYKVLYYSIKIMRSKTIEQTTSLLANNADLKAQIQEKVFAIAALKNESRKLKGNSVDTKFAKTSVLGKPVLQSLIKQSVVRQPNAFKSERPQMSKPLFASQVDVSNNLSRQVTQHYFPKRREFVFAKPDHMIASSESRDSSKNMPRFSSNDMVHNYYLDEARKKTQKRDRNSKSSVIGVSIGRMLKKFGDNSLSKPSLIQKSHDGPEAYEKVLSHVRVTIVPDSHVTPSWREDCLALLLVKLASYT
ncbi:hypothetical protein Tco_0627545 [Tanacetum coccineum]|uniref:Uncharacterized protein n=1 Tax=Tanacetum coccineum TaxID=301880 RepID=A0ABQ4WMX3_9ASTR